MSRCCGADVRWEWYPSTTQTLSAGGFVKMYEGPIESTIEQRAGSGSVGGFQNARSATVAGAELGGRLETGWLRELLDLPAILGQFYVQGNVAILFSEVTLMEQGSATRLQRPLEGQASYVLNAQFGLDRDDHDAAISLNVVGRRLYRAGVLFLPDVMLEAIPTLDAAWSWKFAQYWKLKLRVANILNPEIRFTQGGGEWRSYRRGVSFKAALEFKLE